MLRILSTFLSFALLLAPQAQAQVALERALTDAALGRVTDLQHDPEGRLYVAEQQGSLQVFEGGAYAGVFLDITDRVGEASLEGGILSFAFHPNYAENGEVFVHYLAPDPRRSVIARFTRSAGDALTADAASERIVLEVGQPHYNHNGGSLSFGPDGYLYIALGDGGLGAEWAVNGQDPTTLLGSVLRLDVDDPDDGLSYGIPEDNPFAAAGGPERGEIYAWGFRSPWRMSHDPETGDLWVGDVGQNTWEEVSRVALGSNCGWNVMEGFHCYDPPANCATEGLTLPVWEYSSSGTGNCSVTGGYVYRGSALPELVGRYVYGDFCSGRIWALEVDAGTGEATNTELFDTDLAIVSFGTDAEGELYVLDYLGSVYRFVRGTVGTEPAAAPGRAPTLKVAGPNPFAAATTLEAETPGGGAVRVAVYDVLGREVAVLLDEALAAGAVRRLAFRPEGLPAGVYLVRMTGPGGTATQTLTLLR